MYLRSLRPLLKRQQSVALSNFKLKIESLEVDFTKFVTECECIEDQLKEFDHQEWFTQTIFEKNDLFLYFSDFSNSINIFFESYRKTFNFSQHAIERTRKKVIYFQYLEKFFPNDLIKNFGKFN